MKTLIVQQIKHQLRHNISKHVKFENIGSGMGPLNDETKIQGDDNNNKNWKKMRNP